MKILILAGLVVLGFGIAGGLTWTAANAAQKPLPTRNADYCVMHGGHSLACVLNGKA